MRDIRFIYDFEALYQYCRGVTLKKVYSPDKEENAHLAEMYGLTDDDKEYFIVHCLKFACDELFLNLKRHSFGTEPYGFNIDDGNGIRIVYYDVRIGAVQDDMLTDYIIQSIRNFSISEWYKLKNHLQLAEFHENEYNKFISKVQHYTKGSNKESGNINTSQRRGIFN